MNFTAEPYSAGNEDVGAFMRALGYDFRSDPGADADGLLFKRALRLTHPDKVRNIYITSALDSSVTCARLIPSWSRRRRAAVQARGAANAPRQYCLKTGREIRRRNCQS